MSEIPKINIAEALLHILGENVLCGSTHLNTKAQYEDLNWADERVKPTWKELTDWWNANILLIRQQGVYEEKISAEMLRASRAGAVQTLINAGELPGVPADYTITKETPTP